MQDVNEKARSQYGMNSDAIERKGKGVARSQNLSIQPCTEVNAYLLLWNYWDS